MKRNNNLSGHTNQANIYSFPVMPKVVFDTISEALIEFHADTDTQVLITRDKMFENPSVYDFTRGKHIPSNQQRVIRYPEIDLGFGYTAYIGKLWPKNKETISVAFTKRFHLKSDQTPLVLSQTAPDYKNGPKNAVFTEEFINGLKHEYPYLDVFFLAFIDYGLVSVKGTEARLLFQEGLAVGKIYSDYYYFNVYTNKLKLQYNVTTKKGVKRLENDMWDVTI